MSRFGLPIAGAAGGEAISSHAWRIIRRLLAYVAGDCKFWKRKQAYQIRCGAYFADLDWPAKPPDLPTEGQRRMRVAPGGKK